MQHGAASLVWGHALNQLMYNPIYGTLLQATTHTTASRSAATPSSLAGAVSRCPQSVSRRTGRRKRACPPTTAPSAGALPLRMLLACERDTLHLVQARMRTMSMSATALPHPPLRPTPCASVRPTSPCTHVYHFTCPSPSPPHLPATLQVRQLPGVQDGGRVLPAGAGPHRLRQPAARSCAQPPPRAVLRGRPVLA